MALINTLRNKMGKFLVVVIALSILLFLLSDIFSSNSGFLNRQDTSVGEIAGETISQEEYQELVEQFKNNFARQYGAPSEAIMATFRENAWKLLIVENAFAKQYDELGLEITGDEAYDMEQGKNIDPGIRQAPIFANPQTGQFDKSVLINQLSYIYGLPINHPDRLQWDSYIEQIVTGRARIKYENLLVKTSYVTSAEAEREYHAQTDVAEIKFLYVPYYSVPDSAASFTDSDLNTYLRQNREKYKTDQTRSLKYVRFPFVASAEDSAAIRDELLEIQPNFAEAPNDSIFASVNAEGFGFYQQYSIGTLPYYLQEIAEDLEAGQIVGPVLDGNTYKLYKVSAVEEDTVSSAKASHILFKWSDDSDAAKQTAKSEARRVLREIKGGADFAAMARQYGTDGTASRGGDLGWLGSNDNNWVQPFRDAIFDFGRKGLLNDVVETEFGYHIIEVTSDISNTKFAIATIDKLITPGDATQDEAYKKAELFAAKTDDLEAFTANAQTDSVLVYDAVNLGKNDTRVGQLGDARQIVQWLFRDASNNEVSKSFELDDEYVVAVMTDEVKEGYADIENVRIPVEAEVKKQLKRDIILERLKGLSGTLDEIAASYGQDANVYTSNDVKVGANNLQPVGAEPLAIGKAFSLENGQKSEAFGGEQGVFIVELQAKTIAPEVADYASYKPIVAQGFNSNVSLDIEEVIKEASDIEDKRYKYQ
ncbi:MAG: peptidylprolyl isomerase [Bacteroidota bacterium]